MEARCWISRDYLANVGNASGGWIGRDLSGCWLEAATIVGWVSLVNFACTCSFEQTGRGCASLWGNHHPLSKEVQALWLPMHKTLCPSGLRGWTQVPLAQAAWAQIPQVSCLSIFRTKDFGNLTHKMRGQACRRFAWTTTQRF